MIAGLGCETAFSGTAILQLFTQLVKPVAHGSRGDTHTAMSGIARHVMHWRDARPKQELLGESDAKRTIFFHMNTQCCHGNIAKADGRELDGLIA